MGWATSYYNISYGPPQKATIHINLLQLNGFVDYEAFKNSSCFKNIFNLLSV